MMNPFLDIIGQVLPEPQAGLLNGILFGYKASFSADFYQALLATGTIHIVALSGQNLSILGRILAQVTLNLGRKYSILATVGGLFIFVIFVGPQPSLIRAFIMSCMSLFAIYFGRLNWSLLSLILAAGLMLIVNPGWTGDISFQLSFLATLGIILLGPRMQINKNSLREKLKADFQVNLQTTLAAQFFTLPLILWKFERFSMIAPLTNVLIGWTITPIMILGFILSLAGWLFLPLGQILAWIVWVPLTFVAFIIELTAKIPFAAVKI